MPTPPLVDALTKDTRDADGVIEAVAGNPVETSKAAVAALVDKINEIAAAVSDHETRIVTLETP